MQQRLARAAFEIIAERGISSLRTAAVAERTGVSQGALLHHFATKDDLVIAAVDFSLAAEEARSLQRMQDPALADRQTILNALIEDFRIFFFHDCFWATLDATMDSGRDKRLKAQVTKNVAARRKPIYDGWRALLQRSGMDAQAADELVIMTAALISGLAMRSLWQDMETLSDLAVKRWTVMVKAAWA